MISKSIVKEKCRILAEPVNIDLNNGGDKKENISLLRVYHCTFALEKKKLFFSALEIVLDYSGKVSYVFDKIIKQRKKCNIIKRYRKLCVDVSVVNHPLLGKLFISTH